MGLAHMVRKLREEKNLTQKDVASFLGITRQAVASYELGKREPDYEILKKLADFFHVSVDFLLGRSLFKNSESIIFGKNIELIRGNRSYKEFSEDITKKTGAVITPEMLQLYEKGERLPFMGIIKILVRYAMVHESFFYRQNTIETYETEKNIFRDKPEGQKSSERPEHLTTVLEFMDSDIVKWLMNENNMKYIMLAKEIQESGLSVEPFKALLESIRT